MGQRKSKRDAIVFWPKSKRSPHGHRLRKSSCRTIRAMMGLDGRPPVGLGRILRMYVTQAQALLHGDETNVCGDAGYQGVEKRAENRALPVTWQVARRLGKRKNLSKSTQDEWLARIEPTKASIRAKVEHPFHVIKNLFRHRKARYQGLAKNTAPLFSLFGFANLMLARRWLFSAPSQVAS